MTTKRKVTLSLIVLAIAIPAFLLGPVIWPPSGEIVPDATQLPFLIFVSALEAIALGIGIVWFTLTIRRIASMPAELRKPLRILTVAATWIIVSWWAHDNMHISNGHHDVWRLIRIEYIFHVTMVFAGLAAAWSTSRIMRFLGVPQS